MLFLGKIRDIVEACRKNPVYWTIAFVCFSGFYMFGTLASEVFEGESLAIDTKILLLLRDSAHNPLGPPWLQEMMRDFTALGGIGVLTIVTVAAALYLLIVKRKREALYLVAAIGSGVLIGNIMKLAFDRPRPDIVPHGSIIYMPSFPSGHALMAAIVYITLGALLAQNQPARAIRIYILSVMFFLAILTGISRIYLGVHWPSDVLAGWLAGFSWAMLAWLVNQKFLAPR